MTGPPRPACTHQWDGGATLPAWLGHLHHWHDGQLVVHTPDGHAEPWPGWTLVLWSDGTVTVASPTTTARVYGPDGIAAQLARAEAAVQRITSLHDRWQQAGGPPIGISMSRYFRWWRELLVELHNAIHPPTDQTQE